LLTVEGAPTGDGREFEPNAITWRTLPLPFMAMDVTDEGHDGAKLVANIVDIQRDGPNIYGWTEHIASDDPEVQRLQSLIDNGDLRGVSVDLDQVEGSVIFEEGDEVDLAPNEDGEIVIPMDAPRMVFSAARIMGATATPFPAFAEAQRLGVDPLVASLLTVVTDQAPVLAEAVTAAIVPPNDPPAWWFADPKLVGPTPLTVTDDGHVFGHLALWDSCHIGFSDRCVQPPRSATGYACFRTGEVITAEGTRVRVGQITVDSGHAELRASASKAKEHYDHTGWAGADVAAGEDKFGIWLAGALRPGLDTTKVRAFMAADVSGDWRSVDGKLELVGIASVNVPGFSKAQYSHGDRVALVASVPVCAASDPSYRRIADRIAASVGLTPEQRMAQRDALAMSIGSHPSQRRARLAARVLGR
jgi:hypothetical protein